MNQKTEAELAATAVPEGDQTIPDAVEAPEAATLDAFSAGVEEARAAEASEEVPPVQAEADTAAADPAAAEPPATQDPAQPPAAAAPAQEPPGQQPAPVQSVDDEIKDLGITNERTQKRFRELSERASEADSLRERAGKVSDWEQTIQSTGTTPEQFGATLVYLTDINSGDPARMNRAYETMQNELQVLGKKLGREAPGFDPLTDYPDLAEKVASGDITREVAAELVQNRKRGALQDQHQQSQHQTMQAQQAEQQALQEVAALGQKLQADPQFQQKFAYLGPTIEIIQATMPPAQWAAAIQNAYQRLPAIPAAAPAAPVTKPNNPARASAAPAKPATPKDPGDAFSFGVAEAQARGV